MGLTSELSREHQLILRILSGLEKLAHRTESLGVLDEPTLAREAVQFLRAFADGLHHGKEEHALFPAMQDAGDTGRGPVVAMLREHDSGRGHLGAIDSRIPGAARGDSTDASLFSQRARAYIDLLRIHIAKEDYAVFPLAERIIGGDDQERTARALSGVVKEIGESRVAELWQQGEELAARLERLR